MNSTFPAIKKSYKTHLMIWAIFAIYEILVVSFAVQKILPLADYLIHLFINIIIFYAHAELYQKCRGRYYLIVILILFEILIYSVINFYLERGLAYLDIITTSKKVQFSFAYVSRSTWRALYFIGFSTGFVYILRALEERRLASELKTQNLINTLENQRLENELVKVENDFLRSQINPHFLFNTLSFIYNGTRKAAPEAASAILSLSEMMRYALKQPTSSETIYLRDEVEQVENLINLHRLRTKDGIYIEIRIVGDISNVRFLPLMLLTLAENVFKHGNLTNKARPAEILIDCDNGNLFISTTNLMAHEAHGESNGVGMENIRKRLISYYGDRASLTSNKVEPNMYVAKILIKDI